MIQDKLDFVAVLLCIMKRDLAAHLIKSEDIKNFFPASTHQTVANRHSTLPLDQ